MLYEVFIKNGINLDYFGSREAAELYILKYIKRRELVCKMTREEFEIREKDELVGNRGVVIPGCDWPSRG
tara:strand:- start:2055 stop:2264 length:210 start_codon:yes stop_codon:yes gene_type:complete